MVYYLCLFLIFLYISIDQKIQIIMIGPHYQRLAEAERQITGKQMLERVQAHTENPLTLIIDKLKRQFSQYQTAYTQDIINHQISSVDRLLSFDGKLGPILAALEKQNNLLRRQLSLLQSQLSNSVSICQHLISQNGELKEALIQKNGDISKIIQTVARNQSQSRSQLQQKLALLEQQNSILIQHLEEIKKKHEEYRVNFQSKEQEIKRWQRKWNESKKHLSEAIDREREVTRKLAISEHLLFQQKEKFQILDGKFQNCQLQKLDLERQVAFYQGTKESFDPQALRRTLENEYMQIIQQHRIFKNQRQNILRDGEKNKLQKQKLEDAVNDMQKKFNKVINQYQLTNNLLSQHKGKNQTLISTLKKLQIKIDQLKHENVQLKMQVQSTKSLLFNKQKSSNNEISELRKQFDERSSNSARILREMQVKSQQLLDAKESDIKRLNDEILQYRRMLGK